MPKGRPKGYSCSEETKAKMREAAKKRAPVTSALRKAEWAVRRAMQKRNYGQEFDDRDDT